jgi:RNA polymerase sigma-70 factor (ECF subfamily)
MTSSFDQIWVDHRAYVENVCYRILRNREDMQDAVQDTFIFVYKGLESFAGESSISTWLGSIARNTALRHLENRRKSGFTLHGGGIDRIEVVRLHEAAGQSLPRWCDLLADRTALSPETQVFFQEVMQMVEELPDHLKQPFLLMLQGYTDSEICTMVGMISAFSMIRSRIFRARKNLKQRFTTRHGGQAETRRRGE